MVRPPKIAVFDSGLGGLTVFREIAKIRPEADYIYCADDAGFPYGSWGESALIERVLGVVGGLIERETPDLVAVACNTASTLALPQLRARWPRLPFVGTVPAVKPAAQMSRSRMISVLATPGTVARDYTQKLISEFAGDCEVNLVGSSRLARLAEQAMRGEKIEDEAIAQEIAPCFQEKKGARTDAVVLACTHYPLLADSFERLAPWPVAWVDPAPAIARRVDDMLRQSLGDGEPRPGEPLSRRACFTSNETPTPELASALARYGLTASALEQAAGA
ncbi:glutamate racemase [Methylocystis heyeri]|uniref:glutamate racemase n=1 Tax=Methylocystis heyeri TaxID=391905 RepID=UPI001FE42519|nr:glutamate racemase [Methylocystis heyeri]